MTGTADNLRGLLRTGRNGRRGFTLVEVLVALVILLVGIYAVMVIFPRGYAAMEATQLRTIASQLAESELARWQLAPESLPDAIVATDYNGNLITGTIVGTPSVSGTPGSAAKMLLTWRANQLPMPGSREFDLPVIDYATFADLVRAPGAVYGPEDLTACQYDPVSSYPLDGGATLHPNWQPNSLYLPRTVIGEQIDIRRLGSQGGGVPFYLLSHAPLDYLRKTPDVDDPTTVGLDESKQPPTWMDVYDARTWQYTDSSDLRGRQFTYRASDQRLYFGPINGGSPAGRTFKVDYTGANNVRIYGKTVAADAATGASIDPITGAPLELMPRPSDPSTIRVFEKLRPLTESEAAAYAARGAWPATARNAYYINAATRVTGQIQFCPLLQTAPQPTDITLVKVDYRVQDWQILVFDVEVPPGGVVQLPVTHLKNAGYTNPPRQSQPQPVAKGVRPQYDSQGRRTDLPSSNPASWAYVVAVDRQNGDVLTDSLEATPELLSISPYDRRTQVKVNYRDGVLRFNYGQRGQPQIPPGTYHGAVDTPDRAGRTYRIFCRAEADWAVQLVPSARLYARSATFLPGGLPVGGSAGGALLTYGWYPTKAPQQLYFPLSESGQSVAVSYYAADGRFIEGEVHTIGGPQVTDLQNWVCPLTDPLSYPLDARIGPVTVRGVSVRARAVWVGRGRRPSLEDVARAVDLGLDPVTKRLRAPRLSQESAWYQTFVTTFIPRTPI